MLGSLLTTDIDYKLHILYAGITPPPHAMIIIDVIIIIIIILILFIHL